ISPKRYVDIKIILATQKKIMSYPVSITEVGWNFLRSAVFSGHPRVEKVHRPDENHVSKVSASCSQPLPGVCSATLISSPLYHTGMRCPYQIWRLMHQSCRFSIHCR